jgi:hypothetical protein
MNKKDNIYEYSLLGIFLKYEKNDSSKHIIEEMCENAYNPYHYEITTYKLEAFIENQSIKNTIELHKNLQDSPNTQIDNQIFYNNIQYIDKIEEYLILSKYYLKYIANTFINYDLGSANVVELSRCEDNMDMILQNMGYAIKYKIKKKGFYHKYKNLPIVIIIYSLEKMLDNENIPLKAGEQTYQYLEVIGYCNESNTEKIKIELAHIESKLNR